MAVPSNSSNPSNQSRKKYPMPKKGNTPTTDPKAAAKSKIFGNKGNKKKGGGK